MRAVQREIRQPRIIVVGRVVTRILLGVFFTHSACYAQISAAQSLNSEITGVRILADRRPVVTFKINDRQGRALELSDLDDGSIRFTVAAIKADSNGQTGYHNYILTKVTGKEYVYKGEINKPVLPETLQPDFDNGGALTRLRPGVFTYTFKTTLPANYDRHATHVIGGELTRDKGKFAANPLFEFVPSGGKVKTQRAVVETASCNNCHDPFEISRRREARSRLLRPLSHTSAHRPGNR
jgi:OmcA/MtrC family decaheme c-type cytochrome